MSYELKIYLRFYTLVTFLISSNINVSMNRNCIFNFRGYFRNFEWCLKSVGWNKKFRYIGLDVHSPAAHLSFFIPILIFIFLSQFKFRIMASLTSPPPSFLTFHSRQTRFFSTHHFLPLPLHLPPRYHHYHFTISTFNFPVN